MQKTISIMDDLVHRFYVTSGALLVTAALFLILPQIQTAGKAPKPDLVLQPVETVNEPPPPPPPEEKKPKAPEAKDKPPQLVENTPPLDLAQLELALNPNLGFGDGGLAGDFALKLNTAGTQGGNVDSLFSM